MTRLERDRPDSLSVPEMLRIMDAATSLRLDREHVEEQLNVEELKERLKERMLAASKVTGEPVTPEEVDAAIAQYYARLYTFREPRLGVGVVLAHVWVRRNEILAKAGVLLLAAALVWVLAFSPKSRFTATGRANRRVAQLAGEIDRRAGVVRQLARDPKVAPEVARLVSEAEAYRKVADPDGLATVRDSLADLEKKLGEEYTVSAVTVDTVSGRNKNTIVRFPKGPEGKETRAYYLFVQAKKANGKPVTLRVHNQETGKDKDVTTWAEQIPEAVSERLKKDKLADGILNESTFAVKRKGAIDEEITMPGPDGKPLARLGRITEW